MRLLPAFGFCLGECFVRRGDAVRGKGIAGSQIGGQRCQLAEMDVGVGMELTTKSTKCSEDETGKWMRLDFYKDYGHADIYLFRI